tara:strand:- start:11396 stop:11803 length:408 start_codon:yes stop_codon:yes gene_type:complete
MSNVNQIVVLGEPASKANSRQIVMISGRPAVIKSKKAREYAKTFAEQCAVMNDIKLLEGDLWIEIEIFYKTRRPDLCEDLILDLLQGIAYTNDRQIKEKYIFHGLDKEKPRSIIRIGQICGEEDRGSRHPRSGGI